MLECYVGEANLCYERERVGGAFTARKHRRGKKEIPRRVLYVYNVNMK